jgi:hypothetical protein
MTLTTVPKMHLTLTIFKKVVSVMHNLGFTLLLRGGCNTLNKARGNL